MFSTDVVSVSEYAEKMLGSKIVNKGDLVNSMLETLGRKPPRWCWQPCQRIERGVYTTEWNSKNKFSETTIKVPANLIGSTAKTEPEAKADDYITTPAVEAPEVKIPQPTVLPEGALVPEKFVGFFSTPEYSQIRQVVTSGLFFPIYVTGDTGGGKSLAIRQACATANREMVRVNISSTTSDVHLIGSYKLIDGHTVWQDGPVVTAMRRGSILLLDEIDMATDRIMCLQSVLEGNSLLIERTGEIVKPAAGFNVLATANTKGRVEASTAKFAGARNQNEAFLDRFSMTIEYPYASEKTERKILDSAFTRALAAMGKTRSEADDRFFTTFFLWVRAVREAYMQGVNDFHISTRRAESMLTSYAIFDGNVKKVILGGISRFDSNTKDAFARLFNGMMAEGVDIDWSSNDEEDAD